MLRINYQTDARVFKWEKYQFIAKTARVRLDNIAVAEGLLLLPISKLPQRTLLLRYYF